MNANISKTVRCMERIFSTEVVGFQGGQHTLSNSTDGHFFFKENSRRPCIALDMICSICKGKYKVAHCGFGFCVGYTTFYIVSLISVNIPVLFSYIF